ncbi:aminotransferase class IV family protein [Paracoccus sp. TK19116]|uniref:Probable branched-chain-amino-acid aminotransferase n=1 Tax=Paracoccus albicereus TaxID=2922394 RepID=A0ABT1MTV5_9RHOB|nr:aminotransferase class IV family protein [Paracoccus albicereus]MCQ0971757.1 aminotransferase class IV family protein [Paracoccus albicereus]
MESQIREPVPDGLTVIETMRQEPDGSIALWPMHLSRLRRDCAAVGFPLDEDAVAAVLAHRPEATTRLRLTVDSAGRVGATRAPLPPNPPFWRIEIASVRLRSGDPWLRIKTSHRPAYDAARAALIAGIDEALLLNEAGEVCEGTITNLFLSRDGQLLTPRLAAGLLPGVLRESLISGGEAVEAALYPDDLDDGALYMGNALRGLIPATLDPAT